MWSATSSNSMGKQQSERARSIVLDATKAPRSIANDVTKALSSRQPWSTPMNAMRSTTHQIDPVSASTSVGCSKWSIRQATKQQAYKFWEEQDKKIIMDNRRAAWGATPYWHPKNRNVQPRTKLQKWNSKAVRSVKLHDPTFNSDEPLMNLLQSSDLEYPRRPNDTLTIDTQRSTKPNMTRLMSAQVRNRTRKASHSGDTGTKRPISAVGSHSESSCNSHSAHGMTQQDTDNFFLSEYKAMTLCSQQQENKLPPGLNPLVNPPKQLDAEQDRCRGRQLQSAKADWRTAECLLALGCSATEVKKCFGKAQRTLENVADAADPEYDPEANFEHTTCCSRFV